MRFQSTYLMMGMVLELAGFITVFTLPVLGNTLWLLGTAIVVYSISQNKGTLWLKLIVVAIMTALMILAQI